MSLSVCPEEPALPASEYPGVSRSAICEYGMRGVKMKMHFRMLPRGSSAEPSALWARLAISSGARRTAEPRRLMPSPCSSAPLIRYEGTAVVLSRSVGSRLGPPRSMLRNVDLPLLKLPPMATTRFPTTGPLCRKLLNSPSVFCCSA